MCGICGFNWWDEESLGRMTRILGHRGPDQSGTHSENGVSLGHRRLSVIDLSERGRQPMATEDGRVRIVFNGEIYNHREIRAVLEQKGYRFKSNTDTEVILHAYREYGTKCIEKFNGMFAFCIWDGEKRCFFIARDRLGVKPLYYYYDASGRFVFASEIKSILENPAVPREMDLQALHYFMGYEFIPAPLTIYRGIRKLPAGHYILLSQEGMEVVRYWDVSFREEKRSRRDWEAELVGRIEQAVRRRLESDVPLGAFLSGGIDSSTVVAMMTKIMGGGVKTFSLGYREGGFNELAYARKVAGFFGTDHTELMIDPASVEDIEKVVWHMDEPFSEFSNLPYYLISRKAREFMTVCLSGEGGDEIFVGYDRFRASKFDRIFRAIPGPVRRGLSRAAEGIPDFPKKKGFLNSAKRYIEGSNLPAAGGHMRWQYFLDSGLREALFREPYPASVERDPFAPIGKILEPTGLEEELEKELYVELRFMMPENPLMKVDKMSMAHALEIRAPFLDYELVEFVNTVPAGLKLEGWTTKSILKSAMKDILPNGIAYRSKHGYSFPIKHWLRDGLREYMMEVLSDSPVIREYFDADTVQRLIREHLSGVYNHSHVLWALMNLSVWHRLFMGPRFASESAGAGR